MITADVGGFNSIHFPTPFVRAGLGLNPPVLRNLRSLQQAVRASSGRSFLRYPPCQLRHPPRACISARPWPPAAVGDDSAALGVGICTL